MAAVMDEYLDSPMETDDVFPCKGCGDILEEGKAFELAGNRWHLDCFRCNTCGTLLDSDANLLLLGDGSLICNNCTYSCSACGNKIEDLAILTGDQAFCATCFRCRNCKRKIENLRYARTSQGIFCMSCHESLMARRRKKNKAAQQAKAREKDSPMITDKSLPALPPNAIPPNAFSEDKVAPDDDDAPTELSPRPRPNYPRNDDSSRSSSRPARSPERQTDPSKEGGLGVPAPNYRNNRNSAIFAPPAELPGDGGDSMFIPFALDPSPAPTATPRSTTDTLGDTSRRVKEQDYFGPSSATTKTESQASTPHIAFQAQEKGRQPSSEYEAPVKPPQRKLSKRNKPPQVGQENRKLSNGRIDDFKLQEAPKSKKLANSRSSSQSNVPSENGSKAASGGSRRDSDRSESQLQAPSDGSAPRPSTDSQRSLQDPRGASYDAFGTPRPAWHEKSISRKELTTAPPRPTNGKSIIGQGPTAAQILEESSAPGKQSTEESFMQPRAPPQRPTQTPVKEPGTGGQQQPTQEGPSPKLPRWSSGGDFTLDEDLARILGTDEGSSSLLRRVSNAVRHGRTSSTEFVAPTHQPRGNHTRSISEQTRMTASPRWPKTPTLMEDTQNGQAQEISSPISVSGGAQDDPAFLKRQLRTSEQRLAELERQFTSEKDLKNLNKKLIEKRKTVSVLDTQTEIMIRQLEVLAGYVERAKETKQPIDARDLEDSAIKEFVQKLDKVKQTMTTSIEELHAQRDELIEEKNQAAADRERALLEFEQLSLKNAQLLDMNNDLTQQIQGRFKSQADMKSPQGLGIYQTHKGPSNSSVALDNASITTGQATLVGPDGDDPIVEHGPTVVNIRKGQVRKFNWKKGSKTVAQGLSKGVNRAVGAFQQQPHERDQRNPQFQGLTGDSIGLPYNMTVASVESPVAVSHGLNGQNRMVSDTGRQGGGFGLFGKKNGPGPMQMPKSATAMNMAVSTPTAAEPPSVLFGSELVERSDYERRQIPSVVTRCIEEVELRGMDIEGIYRKTGGNSQVKMIQQGFDNKDDFDISDPSLDITAVTSVLKQYFRKLPTPLLTFDVYDRILESNTIANDAERCVFLRKTVNSLPPKHRDCLEFLIFHLARVADREKENLMSPKNLAVVFAPTIMRDHSLEREMSDMHAKNIAVQFIIDHSDDIFAEA